MALNRVHLCYGIEFGAIGSLQALAVLHTVSETHFQRQTKTPRGPVLGTSAPEASVGANPCM